MYSIYLSYSYIPFTQKVSPDIGNFLALQFSLFWNLKTLVCFVGMHVAMSEDFFTTEKLLNTYETISWSNNFPTHVDLFLNQGTFELMYSFLMSERELDYRHHKNKCESSLSTIQIKTQYLRKLKISWKSIKDLELKVYAQLVSSNNTFDNYILILQKSSLQFFAERSS